MRLIHTADWQIGKAFRVIDDAATVSLLQEARLDAITTIGRLALDHGAGVVLVAGDVYDSADLSDRTLGQPLERMRAFPALAWHLIPGNHDAHVPDGLWDRLAAHGLPANLQVHLAPEPAPLGEGDEAWLLPAPLRHRHESVDPSAWMDEAPTPEGMLRIGLAHGSVADFGSAVPTHNRIDPARPAAARLDYLALGDWHGTRRIGPHCWYAGTPEPDGFGQPDAGAALLVELPGPGAPPTVTPLPVARYDWRTERVTVHDAGDLQVLDERVRAGHADLSRLLVDLTVEGTLSLADRGRFDHQIGQTLGAALRHLRLDDSGLHLQPSPDDLDAIAPAGFVRQAAERLRALAERASGAEREVAELALLRLFVEHRRLVDR